MEEREQREMKVVVIGVAVSREHIVDVLCINLSSGCWLRLTADAGYLVTSVLPVQAVASMFQRELMRLVHAVMMSVADLEGCESREDFLTLHRERCQPFFEYTEAVLQKYAVNPSRVVVPWSVLVRVCSRKQLESILISLDWPVHALEQRGEPRPKVRIATMAKRFLADESFPCPLMLLVLSMPELFSARAAQ